MHRIIDEIVTVYVAFRTPQIAESTLNAYLSRLAINLESFVFSTAPPPEPEAKAAPPKEVIYSETIKDTVEPVIVRSGGNIDPNIYVIWKVEVFICELRAICSDIRSETQLG
jgi:hypothetical protein